MQDRYPPSGPSRDNAAMTWTPTCAIPPTPSSSATAGSAAPGKGTTCEDRSPSCGNDTLEQKSSRISAEVSTGSERDLSPYWNDFTGGDKLQTVVAHRDRLARFGFELIQWLAEQNGGGVLVLNNTDYSPEGELTEDILAILHTFSRRPPGLRRYRKAIQEAIQQAIQEDTDLSHAGAEEDSPAVV